MITAADATLEGAYVGNFTSVFTRGKALEASDAANPPSTIVEQDWADDTEQTDD